MEVSYRYLFNWSYNFLNKTSNFWAIWLASLSRKKIHAPTSQFFYIPSLRSSRHLRGTVISPANQIHPRNPLRQKIFVIHSLFGFSGLSAASDPTYEELSERKYACVQCGKSYKYKQGLVAHTRYKCGKEPQFYCRFCPYRSHHKSHLKTHTLGKHGELYEWSFVHYISLCSSVIVPFFEYKFFCFTGFDEIKYFLPRCSTGDFYYNYWEVSEATRYVNLRPRGPEERI